MIFYMILSIQLQYQILYTYLIVGSGAAKHKSVSICIRVVFRSLSNTHGLHDTLQTWDFYSFSYIFVFQTCRKPIDTMPLFNVVGFTMSHYISLNVIICLYVHVLLLVAYRPYLHAIHFIVIYNPALLSVATIICWLHLILTCLIIVIPAIYSQNNQNRCCNQNICLISPYSICSKLGKWV